MLCFSVIVGKYLCGVEVKMVMSTAGDSAVGYQKYVAMYDFAPRNFDELSLKAGDHVLVNIVTCLIL